MKRFLALALMLVFAGCPPLTYGNFPASYEVKVNLDPVAAEAHLADIVGSVEPFERTSIYYRLRRDARVFDTIVRARRRTSDNKTDLDVKVRDVDDYSATLMTDPEDGLDEVECEYDANLLADGPGKLSCDIKTKFSGDTTPLDGATTLSRLDEEQMQLLQVGTGHRRAQLTACPGIPAQIYDDLEPIEGCDEVTLEVWPFPQGTLYELSCKTTTLDAARTGLQARIDALGIAPAADQDGKTTHALAACAL